MINEDIASEKAIAAIQSVADFIKLTGYEVEAMKNCIKEMVTVTITLNQKIDFIFDEIQAMKMRV